MGVVCSQVYNIDVNIFSSLMRLCSPIAKKNSWTINIKEAEILNVVDDGPWKFGLW
jgi:hypothetical protein